MVAELESALNMKNTKIAQLSYRLLIAAVVLCLCTFCLQAQQPLSHAKGKITGRIIDSISGKPVEYATISLVVQEKDKKDKVVNGTTSDDRGIFKLKEMEDGTYKMFIYFMGYQTAVRNNIVIGKTITTVALGDIK